MSLTMVGDEFAGVEGDAPSLDAVGDRLEEARHDVDQVFDISRVAEVRPRRRIRLDGQGRISDRRQARGGRGRLRGRRRRAGDLGCRWRQRRRRTVRAEARRSLVRLGDRRRARRRRVGITCCDRGRESEQQEYRSRCRHGSSLGRALCHRHDHRRCSWPLHDDGSGRSATPTAIAARAALSTTTSGRPTSSRPHRDLIPAFAGGRRSTKRSARRPRGRPAQRSRSRSPPRRRRRHPSRWRQRRDRRRSDRRRRRSRR